MAAVILSGWLTFDVRRIRGFTLKQPVLQPDQKAIYLQLSVPTAVFKVPTITAKIALPPPGEGLDIVAVAAEVDAVLRSADFKVEVMALPASGSDGV